MSTIVSMLYHTGLRAGELAALHMSDITLGERSGVDVVVKYGHLTGLEDVTPHTLRHSLARALLAAGTLLSDVADLLRHSSLDTTRIYTKASETDLASAVSRLEGIECNLMPFSAYPLPSCWSCRV